MKFLNNFALFAVLLSILTIPFGVMGIAGVSIPSQDVLPASTIYRPENKTYDYLYSTIEESTHSEDMVK